MLCEKLLLALLPGERGPRQNCYRAAAVAGGHPPSPQLPPHTALCVHPQGDSLSFCLCVWGVYVCMFTYMQMLKCGGQRTSKDVLPQVCTLSFQIGSLTGLELGK